MISFSQAMMLAMDALPRRRRVPAEGGWILRHHGLKSTFLIAWPLLSCLGGCGGPKPVTIVDHPLVLTPEPVTLALNPPLQARGARFDFSFDMPKKALCSISDWVFYGNAGQRVGITITFVTADGHRDRFGSDYLNFNPKEVPQQCTRDQTPFGRLPTSARPVYTHVELSATDSITIVGLTVKTWDPEPLFP